MTERDREALSTWERGERSNPYPPTGPRRTQDDQARCYYCGADTDERPSLDGHTFCSRACSDAWVRR